MEKEKKEYFKNFRRQYVDLRKIMSEEFKYVKNYNKYNNSDHEFESIFARFNYNIPVIDKTHSDLSWIDFRDYIISDFLSLPYPPCNLYINEEDILGVWFVPHEFLFNQIKSDEIHNIMNNLKEQLKTLEVCQLYELTRSGGERELDKYFYFDNYYRKDEFKKLFIAK